MIPSLIDAVRGFLSGDGALILPELELILFACGILLIDRWLTANEKHWNAILAIAGTAFSGFTLYVQRGKLVALQDANPDTPGLLGIHKSMLVDSFFLFFASLFLAATLLVILLTWRREECGGVQRGAYYASLLFGCVGMMLMVSSLDLTVVLAGLEILALSSYWLLGIARAELDTRVAQRNYALLWVCSSVALGLGFLLLYGQFRTTNVGRIGAILSVRLNNGVALGGLATWQGWLALGLTAAGMFLLVEAAPLQWFAPGIYEFAPARVEVYLGTAARTAAFALLLRLFSFVFIFAHQKWIHVWGGVAILSLLWGNIAALRTKSVTRLLGYGAIAQTGFILLGLVAGNETGFSGLAYYLWVYVFMTAGAFGILLIGKQPSTGNSLQLADLDGLFSRNPIAAVFLLFFMMALAGIPPTAGFLAKYYIVKGLFEAPHPQLAVFAILNALAGVYCYGRVVMHAWKKSAGAAPLLEAPALAFSNAQTVALTVAAFVSLAAGLYPEPFLRLARYAFGQ
jgi:NADH-quinone oxidoreductase subunit N